MPVNDYECLIMLDTSKVAGDLPTAVQQIHTIYEKHHCEVLASRPWDERRLSYQIGNQKKALYYLTYFRSEGKNIDGIEHDFHLNESIMRHMILKIEPKWAEKMLELAKDEHALALQAVVEDPNDDFGDFGGGGRRDRGPRESRPMAGAGKD